MKKILFVPALVVMCGFVLAGCQTLSEPDVQTQCNQAIDAASKQLQAHNMQAITPNWIQAEHVIRGAQLKRSQQDYLHCTQDAELALKMLK